MKIHILMLDGTNKPHYNVTFTKVAKIVPDSEMRCLLFYDTDLEYPSKPDVLRGTINADKMLYYEVVDDD